MDIFGWPKEIWLRALLTLLIRDNSRLFADLAPSPCCVWTALAWDVSVNPGHSRTSKHSTLLTRECCSLLTCYSEQCYSHTGVTVTPLFTALQKRLSVQSRSYCEGEAVVSGCEIQSRSPQSQLVNEFNSSHSTALRLVTTRNNSTALKLDVIVATIQLQLVTRFSQPL